MGDEIKHGVKLTVINSMDYDNLNEILQAIKDKGFKITAAENGNFVCEKEVVMSHE